MIRRIAVGSYTENAGHVPDARGAGISILELDDESMEIRSLSVRRVPSPSYLAFDKIGRFLYSVSESAGNPESSWHLDENGDIELIEQAAGIGLSGCHLTLSPNNKQLFTASYSKGQMTTYELTNGGFASPGRSITYSGNGPNSHRQEAPHAHQVLASPSGDFLYVCDLGCDTVWKHRIKELERPPSVALEVPPGYGPRHLAFDLRNDIAYILCELIPRILVVSMDRASGNMTILQEVDSTLPEFMGKAAPAAVKVHPSGRSLAVSNRFDDTISVFTLNGGTGAQVALAENFPCRGKTPRDINFTEDGGILFIANQDSHDIQIRYFNKETGLPIERWGPKIDIGSPACVINIQNI